MRTDIVARIRSEVQSGIAIPKPDSTEPHRVKGWGVRRGEPALIYQMPNHRNPDKPHERGITESEWQAAWATLQHSKEPSRFWFETKLPACNAEGGCNFTTIGGVFVLLGEAAYERGRYVAMGRSGDHRA